MKKIFSLTIILAMLLPLCFIGISAEDTTIVNTRPDWLITEICPNTEGSADSTFGYINGRDPFEALEIYNNSDHTLDLYDYCLTYNGNVGTSEKFETQIVEITPFLTNNTWENKPGNYLDGSTATSTQMPTNPQYCEVASGECVVIWVMYCEAYYADYSTDGVTTGLSIENFRDFWNIPENVKVIACDGNSNVTGTYTSLITGETISTNGYDKNFNLKNSDTGTYGLALYSEALNTAANTTTGSTNVFTCADGYSACTDMAVWATVDFTYIPVLSANYSVEFTYDLDGTANFAKYGKSYSSNRMLMSDFNCISSFGTLSNYQKMTIPEYQFSTGEKITLPELYNAETGYQFDGWKIDSNTTTNIPYEEITLAAGTHTFTPVYSLIPETTAAPETSAPDTTTTAPVTTLSPETTVNPEGTTVATKTTTEEKSGCGKSSIVIAIAEAVIAVGGAATFVVFKRK